MIATEVLRFDNVFFVNRHVKSVALQCKNGELFNVFSRTLRVNVEVQKRPLVCVENDPSMQV